MSLYTVVVENIDENITEMWIVKASDEEEAKAIIERDSKNWGNFTVTNAVFLRKALPTDTEAMGYLEAKLVYSWEHK